jgi:hypothetical protein
VNTFIDGRCVVTQRATKGGNVAVDIYVPPLEGLKQERHFRFYRKTPLAPIDQWKDVHPSTRRLLKKVNTFVTGRVLVATFRQAIDDGQITRAQATEIREDLEKTWPRGTYTSREFQDAAIRRLFALTGDENHYWHDARLEANT